MPRIHGGDLHQIQQQYPDVRSDWVDLSTGINPWGYPWLENIAPSVLNSAGNRLPGKADYENCRSAYARYLGCEKENILFGAGSQALIEKIPLLFNHTEVFILGPTYREHEHSWDRIGHIIHYLPYALESLAMIPEGKVVIITSPNNPDGQIMDRDRLYEFVTDYCARGGSVIIDEAFMDLSPEHSLIGYDLPVQTFILRSLGKFFGLAGMRLGVLYADPSFCQRLMGLSSLWNISTLSLIIATHALGDQVWITENRIKLAQAMMRLSAMITAAGYEVIGRTDLFCLIKDENIADLFHRLAQNGIYVRTFANQPLLLRLGLPPTEEAFTRLSQVFQGENTIMSSSAQSEQQRNAAHKAAMQEQQARQREIVKSKKKADHSLLLVNTGDGKGKSTAAFGTVLRALGVGWKVGIVQYIKGTWKTGEKEFFNRFSDLVDLRAMGEGFTWNTQDRERDIQAARAAWDVSCRMMTSGDYQLVLLDELNIVLRNDYLPLDKVIEKIAGRHKDTHVIVTGRNAPQELMDSADLVTEMKKVKHPFDAGVKAIRGLDF